MDHLDQKSYYKYSKYTELTLETYTTLRCAECLLHVLTSRGQSGNISLAQIWRSPNDFFRHLIIFLSKIKALPAIEITVL